MAVRISSELVREQLSLSRAACCARLFEWAVNDVLHCGKSDTHTHTHTQIHTQSCLSMTENTGGERVRLYNLPIGQNGVFFPPVGLMAAVELCVHAFAIVHSCLCVSLYVQHYYVYGRCTCQVEL